MSCIQIVDLKRLESDRFNYPTAKKPQPTPQPTQ